MSQTIQKEARRYRALLHPLLAGSIVLMALGLILSGGFGPLWQGMVTIVTSQSVLVTDYVALAGLGPALFNSGAVALCAILVLRLCGDVFNGFTIVTAGLMAGFALFGKNVANIWPIILGGWLYARAKREPFSKYCNVAMMATALSPLVSFMTLSWERVAGRSQAGCGAAPSPQGKVKMQFKKTKLAKFGPVFTKTLFKSPKYERSH